MTVQVYRMEQPQGDGGTHVTLRVMVSLIQRGASNPLVRDAAIRMTRGVGERDQIGQLAILRWFLQSHVTFMRDPAGIELVQAPDVLLRQIMRDGVAAMDCDDVAVLAGALAKSIGFPVRLMAVALDGRPVFGHVWAEARNRQGQWVDFDVTRSAQGLERARITRVLPMRVP